MQTEIDVTDFLEHYGVKGMKWGVRKDGKTGGTRAALKERFTPKEKRPPSEDATTAASIRSKTNRRDVSPLTNKELQTAITRMNLEKQYSQLVPPTPGSKAQKFAADFVATQAKQTLNTMAQTEIQKLVKKNMS